ncbi:hypothetical protein AB0C34_17095 [Nocardia sp. NPDC049220]|uniref:hypothetical protein n=1 Tax=Nocardia sp. NPDC049220 TaxID=3155273 RepID=UPI0033C398E8
MVDGVAGGSDFAGKAGRTCRIGGVGEDAGGFVGLADQAQRGVEADIIGRIRERA